MAAALGGAGAAYLAGSAITGIIGAAMGKCVSSPLVSVGCSQESNISMDTTQISSIIKETMITYQVDTTQSIDATQTLTVNISDVSCKNINISQKINIQAKLVSDISNTVSEQIIQRVTSELDSKLDNLQKTKNDMFSAMSNQISNMDLKTYINNKITDSFSMKTLTDIKQKVNLNQGGTINITNVNCENLVIDQSLVLSLFAEVATLNFVNKLMDIDEYRKLLTDAANKQEQENKGLNQIIDSIMSMLKMYGIIIAVIVVAAIIGFVIFAQGGGLKDLQELKNGYYYF